MNTIFDVAKEAGVSKSTVSRVLNYDPHVKEETKLAVEAAIKKLNYSPSYFAQGIRTGKTMAIAMLVPEYTNVFYNELFKGVEDVALKHGYMVFICNTERHKKSEKEYTDELIKRNIDGIIYNTYSTDKELIRHYLDLSRKLPVVFMDKVFDFKEDKNISYVITDGYESTRKAVYHLFDRGKRKIGYIRNIENIRVTEERYQGYLKGMEDCGLAVNEKFICKLQPTEELDYIKRGRDSADYYASLDERPDALLAAIDMLAIGCVQQLRRHHIRVPEDINIIGFDNISLSELVEPTLTTIKQPIRELGQKAAEIIIAKINGREIEDRVVFNGELILRETTN
ncbi:MAG: LacI family DNA-binding transcriptional regulator [Lachnospiraceae bacterium]